MSLLKEMLKNPNVVAVKNSSMPTQDIQMFKDAGIADRGEATSWCSTAPMSSSFPAV